MKAACDTALWLGTLALALLPWAAMGVQSASPAPAEDSRGLVRTYLVRLHGASGPDVQRQMVDSIAGRLALFETLAARCEPRGMDEIVVRVTARDEESLEEIPALLQKPGGLELRCVHPESDALLQQGACPAGYEIMAEHALSNRAVQVHLVAQQPSGPSREHVSAAKAALDPVGGQWTVEIAFSKEGAQIFADVTRTNIGRRIALVVDGEVRMAPVVREEIKGGQCLITGRFSSSDARRLGALIAYPLPARVDTVSVMAHAPPARVTFEVMLVELTGENERALTMDRFLGAAPDAPPAADLSSNNTRFLTLRGLLQDRQFRERLAALDATPTDGIAELRGDQLDWGGNHLTNAANIRLSANLGTAAATVLAEPEYRLLLRALEQRVDAKVQSAPRLTIAGGQQTRVHLVQVTNVHTAINPDAIVQPGIWGRTNIPIHVSASIPVGPSVDLRPTMRPDGATLELTVRPTLTRFVGYDPPIKNTRVRVWKNGVKKWVAPPLPRFHIRQTEAKVTIAEGQTALLATWPAAEWGGARSVQSARVRSSPRTPARAVYHRLLIFVTPRLVHAADGPAQAAALPGAPP